MRVLIIEDNADLAAMVYEDLEARGHVPDVAYDGVNGLHMAQSGDYDAVILDLGLPRMDGVELCRRLRTETASALPILMLTARDQLEDKLAGFQAGTDDYLVKPFDLDELAARLEALYRRTTAEFGSLGRLSCGDLTVDLDRHQVRRGDSSVDLEPIAYRILVYLMRNQSRVVARSELMDHIWGDSPPEADALRVHISKLRGAVDRPFGTETIVTVPKFGFRMDCQDAITEGSGREP